MTYRKRIYRRRAFRVRSAMSALIVWMLCATFLAPVATAEVVNLRVNQIVQNGGQFTLYVSATDRDNNPVAVNDPTESYEVRADALQPVTPLSAAAFSATGESVSYIIAVDVSGSVTKQEVKDIKQALHGFVSRLSGDYIKLITIGSEINVVADFTNDRSALDAIIDSKIHRDDPKTYLYQGLIRAMESATTQMVGGPRRTAMIIFTDGGDDSDGVWTADDVIERMESTRLPVYAVALKGNAKMNPSAVNRLCEDTGGALYKEEDYTVAGALDRIRSAVENCVVLTCAPADPAYFGVKASRWSVSLQAGGRMVNSSTYQITTSPTSPPERVALTFHDAGILKAIKLRLGKADDADLFEEDMAAIAALTELYAQDMGISDLQDLAMMPNLKELFLKNNNVSDISVLKQLSQLTAVNLDGNGLKDISTLKYIDNLKTLSAKNNELGDITFVRTLDNLDQMDLSDNQIEDIAPLRNLSNLTSLNLSNNRITSVQPLASVASLTALDLRGNPFTDQEALRALADAGCLILLDAPIATPTPKPTPSPTPTPAPTLATTAVTSPTPSPVPSAGQMAIRWVLTNWLYLIIAAIALLVLIIILTVVRGGKRADPEKIARKDWDYDISDDPEKTIAMDEFFGDDPEKTVELDKGGLKIRFLVEYKGRTKESVLPIRKTLIIGRAADSGLVLEDKTVTRHHAELNLKYDALYIQDSNSAAGTILNGSQITREANLRKGDVLKLGETTVKIADIGR